MGISLKPQHLKRYRQLARLMLRYGRADMVRDSGLEAALLEEDRVEARPGEAAKAEHLADDLERMGPTFVKLGQLLSTRPDLVPAPYADALARLQDDVEPFPFEEVERIVTAELGVRLSRAFASFDETPLAAASLGQVHRATLRDGRPVAVKVQRPGVRERIVEDLDALGEIADFMDRHTAAGRRYEFGRLLEELRRGVIIELDYRREASHMERLGANLAEFERILVPAAVDGYSTSRVLTMEYVRGKKITSLGPLARMELPGAALAEELFRAYLKQILVDGFFHADPHPGNVFVTDDGRIALIDLGMVGQIAPELQQRLLRMILAVSEGRGEEAAEVAIEIGERRGDFDRAEFVRTAAAATAGFQGTAREIQVGRMLLEVSRNAAENGLRMPPELAMLGRALLALDQVGRTLDPDFDPNDTIRRNAADVMRQRMLRGASPANAFSGLLEMNDFVQRLPGRLNRALDSFVNNETEVRIRLAEEAWMLAGMQKISNRIATGLVLAALIVGAAMLMRIPTRMTLFGYPAIAMVLFLLAAAMGFWMVISALLHDVRHDRSTRKK